MALTRKMLSAMDIPAEKIDEIISAHTETVNAIKEERDQAKSDMEALKSKEKELEEATKELEKFRSGDWEEKYKSLKSEYDNYKTDTETKATKAAKTSAYRKLLVEAGIPEKRIDSILKVSASAIEEIELDKDGNIKGAEKLSESVKTEWADFIPEKKEQGADVAKPPANNGGEVKKPSRAKELVAQYRNDHYGNPTKEE